MRRYAVIGGGITGLMAARTLASVGQPGSVILFEADERLGGKLHTQTWTGGRIEGGADSLLARGGRVDGLVDELGLTEQLVEPAIFQALVWTGSRLVPFPAGTELGIPVAPLGARSSLGLRASLRAAMEMLHRARLRGPDVPVGRFVRERFGDKVLELLVDPILGGTRAGDPERMSLAAAMPAVDAAARSYRSVTRGLRWERGTGRTPAAPRFLSFEGGMSHLVSALERDLSRRGVQVRTGTPVQELHLGRRGVRIVASDPGADPEADPRIERGKGGRLRPPGDGGAAFDGVILTLPARRAGDLLAPAAPGVAATLRGFRYASAASVALAFDAAADPAIPGSGLLIPSRRGRVLSAVTWFSRKWPHTAPRGTFTARCFVGRAGTHPALALDDGGLVEAVLQDLRMVSGIGADPRAHLVTRWDEGLPQYEVGHLDRVSEVEDELAGLPVVVAGAGYRGSGISDCLVQGETAALQLLQTTGA